MRPAVPPSVRTFAIVVSKTSHVATRVHPKPRIERNWKFRCSLVSQNAVAPNAGLLTLNCCTLPSADISLLSAAVPCHFFFTACSESSNPSSSSMSKSVGRTCSARSLGSVVPAALEDDEAGILVTGRSSVPDFCIPENRPDEEAQDTGTKRRGQRAQNKPPQLKYQRRHGTMCQILGKEVQFAEHPAQVEGPTSCSGQIGRAHV